ncbi:MAG: hypothetical protein BGO05_05530 [Rhizobiales bacterium 63-7]|nr:MAG: hypothetical protein BGO05_05530 [Rhizobiales bacterium 63-7]
MHYHFNYHLLSTPSLVQIHDHLFESLMLDLSRDDQICGIRVYPDFAVARDEIERALTDRGVSFYPISWW